MYSVGPSLFSSLMFDNCKQYWPKTGTYQILDSQVSEVPQDILRTNLVIRLEIQQRARPSGKTLLGGEGAVTQVRQD